MRTERPPQTGPGRRSVAPARRGLASFAVALIGVALSGYLTAEHFSASTTLACPESATVSCQKVTTSQWSHAFDIPVAVLGLAFFVAMALLCTPYAWRRRSLSAVRVAGAVIGVLVALYLVWIELFRVDAICLWCTAAHVCALALLGAVLWEHSAPTAAAPTHPGHLQEATWAHWHW